jgi:hypothetical protein
MHVKFQIRIPSPCQENWDAMRPEEKGRHCASCQKTVIDFTGMSDREIIGHLARAGQGVCGRMAPDQIDRDMSLLAPPRLNGVRGWPWVFVGVMMAADPSVGRPPLTGDVVVRKVDTILQPPVIVGEPTVKRMGKVAVDVDELRVTKGEVEIGAVRVLDSTNDKSKQLMGTPVCIKSDTLSVIPADLVKPEVGEAVYGIAGGISIGLAVSPVQNLLDTVKHWVEDSLAAMRLLPERGFSVYPNPVRRGAVVSLSWKAERGTYRVGLINISGGLVQEREVVVRAKGQVDLFEVPAGVSSGVYVIWAVGDGGKGMTRELVVQ